jgi:hypothetical protein
MSPGGRYVTSAAAEAAALCRMTSSEAAAVCTYVLAGSRQLEQGGTAAACSAAGCLTARLPPSINAINPIKVSRMHSPCVEQQATELLLLGHQPAASGSAHHPCILHVDTLVLHHAAQLLLPCITSIHSTCCRAANIPMCCTYFARCVAG